MTDYSSIAKKTNASKNLGSKMAHMTVEFRENMLQ